MSVIEAPLTGDLARRLSEAEATIEALLSGEIDAVVDSKSKTPVLLSKAQEALRESEERYHVIFDASPLPMWLYETPSLRICAVNQAAIDLYGYSPKDFLEMTLYELRSPAEAERLRKLFADTPEPPVRWDTGVWVHRKKDGTPMDMEIHTHLVVVGAAPCG